MPSSEDNKSAVEAMFQDADPRLHYNKQLVLRFLNELMQAGHWENAHEVMSERYIQHNPLTESGIQPVREFFVDILELPRLAEIAPLALPVTAVIAQNDFVCVIFPCRVAHPDKPGESYDANWFDAWRIVDGKLDEHWDSMRLVGGMTAKEIALSSFSPA